MNFDEADVDWILENTAPIEFTVFVIFTENAFSTRVYLEQYMYVTFSGRIEMLVTDMNVYYVKVDGEWKVSGIVFE